MNKLAQITLAACATLSAASVMATPVSLGSIEHLYGTDAGRQLSSVMSEYHPGGNCDSASASAITVKATKASSCNRFADIFDFSGIDFSSIDHFELTLNASNTRNQVGGLERWTVRGGYNYAVAGTTFGSALNANGSQTFSFDNSKALFSNILSGEKFVLSFSTDWGTSMNFDLSSAKLELFGAAPAASQVPEPASLALVGLALVGLAGARRSRKTIKA